MPSRRAISDGSNTIRLERLDLRDLGTRRGLAPLVFPFGLRTGNPFSLPFEHKFAFKGPDSANDREHQPTGRGARVGPQVQNGQVSPLGLHPISDVEQMLCRAGKSIELRDDKRVTLPDELKRGLKLRT